ncbi:permease component of an ABC superfamily transporter [Tetragenococcus muriaticus 3MR10-3]|uniref:Permease component of an ABC superfamily transporter n=1 Tax=Tetragenococcus muriaticus 3MR10-3 TaxID=1302648 RepID=A0A091BZ52_9ENTE|nr:permease component of an ABC superfamily transporter [Tetragenococcus muriaticus 3MR10-3]
MDKTRFKELLKVNLRYANPQQTTKNREKGKSGASLTRSLVMQYFYSGLLFLLIYGFTMLGLDFSQLPGYFTYYMALFGIIAFSQGISVTYNIFFQSQDLPNFLPLPFRQSELFLSKIAVAILTITPLVLPVFVLFIFAGIRSNIFILWAIVGAILLFSCFLGVIFSICSFIVFGLAKTKLFKRHKQLMTSILLIVSVVIAVLGDFGDELANYSNTNDGFRSTCYWLFTSFFLCNYATFNNKWIIKSLWFSRRSGAFGYFI